MWTARHFCFDPTERGGLKWPPPPPGCYAVGEHSQATAFIADDETSPHSPPTVAIVRPTDGASFLAPARIEIIATAKASAAWIRAVEFFAGDRSLGVVQFSATVDSFRLIWENVPSSAYTLTAKATDSLGATAGQPPSTHRLAKSYPHLILQDVLADQAVRNRACNVSSAASLVALTLPRHRDGALVICPWRSAHTYS